MSDKGDELTPEHEVLGMHAFIENQFDISSHLSGSTYIFLTFTPGQEKGVVSSNLNDAEKVAAVLKKLVLN